MSDFELGKVTKFATRRGYTCSCLGMGLSYINFRLQRKTFSEQE